MTLEEIIKQTSIEFPKEINLSEAEKLIRYIAQNLSVEIRYNSENHIIISQKYLKDNFSEINGSINSLKNKMAFDSFRFEQSQKNHSKFTKIKFQTIPRYKINEYRTEVKELWNNVRNVVNNYFLKSI